MLDACAERKLHRRIDGPLLEREERHGIRIALRHEGLLPERREGVLRKLHADGTLHRPDLRVTRFDAPLVAMVLERRARLAVFDFLVLVVGVTEVELERRERTTQVAHLACQRQALLAQANARVFLGNGAIVGVVTGVRQPGVAVGPRPRRPGSRPADLPVAVGQRAGRLRCLLAVECATLCRVGEAGNAQVGALAREAVDMEGELAVAEFELRSARALAVGPAVAEVRCTGNPCERLARNSVVDGVDHTTDRIASVKQRGGAAHDFDALDRQRILRHGMVVGQRRGIERGGAVLQHANAIAVEAADDRTADVRAVGCGRDARQAVQCLAERAGATQRQRFAVELGHRHGQLRGRAPERVPGHESGGQYGFRYGARRGRGIGGAGGRARQRERTDAQRGGQR